MTAAPPFESRRYPSKSFERASLQHFLSELCDVLNLPRPDPAKTVNEENTYSFERKVYIRENDGAKVLKRLDLYRRGCFVLEAKQGTDPSAFLPGQTSFSAPVRGSRQWRDMMIRGWKQAEHYARSLPRGEGRPPFVIVVDVGHCFDLYAEFSCTGGMYLHYPDPKNHRIMLADLNKSDVRDRLRAIWLDPMSLDLSRRAAKVTEKVAGYLATLARSLESDGHDPTLVSQFLMRCIFAMFAEHIRILAENSFTDMIERCIINPDMYEHSMRNLWEAMNRVGWSFVTDGRVPRFNGKLFANPQILPLKREQMSVMLQAAQAEWMEVEPAIFGTLIERALDLKERHKLGVHYTPRAYIERLVIPTIMKPLREEWDSVQIAARVVFESGREAEACGIVRKYHNRLCKVRVLDPACGSGNFLYVTMEHMKRLEGEVFEALASYGEKHLSHLQVGPHQFLGLEINPRAASIAEMVLWIGYLQWHLKTYGDVKPPDPSIRKLDNIQCKDALISYDSWKYASDENGMPIEQWDRETYRTDPVTDRKIPDESATKVDIDYVGVTAAVWPKADFIIGNPPFVGGKGRDKRQTLGNGYYCALTKTYKEIPKSCDLVMYWWHKAAQLVREKQVRRFGFITTNSITQVYNRRVVEMNLNSDPPLSLAFAIPDHPWVGVEDGASVRIAMTVGKYGFGEGLLVSVDEGTRTAGREASVSLAERTGFIHADLRLRSSVVSAVHLRANTDMCCHGVMLAGMGFVVTEEEAKALGVGRVVGLETRIRPYRNGKDLMGVPRGVLVIDLFGLSSIDVRNQFPDVYQWVYSRVKPERDMNNNESLRSAWWIFGGPRESLRAALVGLHRFVATVETAKHRVFVFLPTCVLPDITVVSVATSDAFHLGVLSSRIHVVWSLATGGRLESRPRYNTSVCFATFPFPDATAEQLTRIRDLGEQLDHHRKNRQELHGDVTLTGMYNVLDALRSKRPLSDHENHIHDAGLVGILREIHDELDSAVADAYGWPSDLPDEEILSRLVVLNAERAEEERNGLIRWLRPEFQTETKEQRESPQTKISFASTTSTEAKKPKQTKNKSPAEKQPWPSDLLEQTQAVGSVVRVLQADGEPVNVNTIIDHFVRAPRAKVEVIMRSLGELGLT